MKQGAGVYRRGSVWYFNALINGTRYVEKIGRGVSRTVAAEIASVKRATILRGEAGIGKEKRKPRDIPFDDASKEFLGWVEMNRKAGTAVFYANRLAILGKTFCGKMLSEIQPKDIEQYKQSRVTSDRGRAAVNRDLATLRALYSRMIKDKLYEGPTRPSRPRSSGFRNHRGVCGSSSGKRRPNFSSTRRSLCAPSSYVGWMLGSGSQPKPLPCGGRRSTSAAARSRSRAHTPRMASSARSPSRRG